MIVSVATRTYLSLPVKGSLSKGHCVITPIDHVPSMLHADEDVWTEVRVFFPFSLSLSLSLSLLFKQTIFFFFF